MKNLKKTLALALALLLALALCACQNTAQTPAATDAPAPTEEQPVGAPSRDETVDFVVVGAGAAGVSAATEAARQGKSVVLLEKLAFAGGSSALNEGYFWSCDSEFNELTGKGYSKERMKEYLRESSRGNANDALNDNIVDISAEIMNFIVDEGAVFYTDKFTGSGGDAQDLDIFVAEGAGNGLFTSLLGIAEKYGVTPRYESPAVGLIVENGAVKGVTVEDKDGQYNIYAETTVLCTGGFLKSEELMMEYMPEWYSENAYCTAGATGDGHKWALELGAQMVGYGCGGVWRTEDGKNGYHVEGGLAPCVSFFITNIEGQRFCNEYMGSDKNQFINEQSDKKAYCFMDSTSPYVSLAEAGVAAGYTYKADTLEELADIYGINKENLLQTVADYNECKATGGQDPFYVPNEYMVSMTTPPYYMSLFDPSMNTNCLMGLATDAYCRILGADGAPIEGLYGAGELIMGNLCGGTKQGARYPACGTCLAAGIYGGPLAVRHALGLYAEAEAQAEASAASDEYVPTTATMSYSEDVKAMAHEILMAAGQPYTDEQLKEIPRILATKSRYFLGNDLNDYEVLRDVFTEEGLEGFRAIWSGYPGATDIESQIGSVQFTIGQGDVVPTHYGVNQIVYFVDDTHAKLLTRMHDHHTYTDNGEVYEGYGIYVDDMLKCEDGVWRIETLRLDYGVTVGELRCMREN